MKTLASALVVALMAASARASTPTLSDLLSHRASRFSGTIAFDPATLAANVDVSVDLTTSGQGRTAVYFAAAIPIARVRDAGGADLPFAALPPPYQPLVEVTLPAPAPDGTAVTLRVGMAGTPACPLGDVLGRQLCGAGEVAWLDLSTVLPCSLGGDWATLDLDVVVPAGLRLGGSGEVTRVASAGPGTESHHFVQSFASGLHGLAVGPYVEAVAWAGDLRVHALARHALEPALPGALALAVSALSWYAGRFGPLPFPAVTIAEVSPDSGAAYAFPGLVLLPPGPWSGQGGGTLHPPDLGYVVLPHELAHQWFPMSMQPSLGTGAWASEGLAEFSAIEFLRATRGDATATALYARYSRDYRLGVGPDKDFALAGSDPFKAANRDVYYRVVYEKGALVIASLRAGVGAAAFDATIRGLHDDLAGRDEFWDLEMFQARLEAASGVTLSWLLDEWLRRTGAPSWTVTISAPPAGPAIVRVDPAISGPSAGFRMPAVITAATSAGDVTRTLDPVDSPVAVEWTLPGRLLGVRVDPAVTFALAVRPGIPGDVDLSGEVDAIDALRVAAAAGTAWPDPAYDEAADLDGSGAVDDADLEAVTTAFGTRGY